MLKGFQHKTTEAWLDNDFQDPHFQDIYAYIDAVHDGDIEAFTALHGSSPEDWEKQEITQAEIDTIFYVPPDIEVIRVDKLQTLNDELHSYLSELGLDQGSQTSFVALYSDVLDDLIQNGTLTVKKGEVKAKIREVWTFIQGYVMPYYYQQKAELEQTNDPAGFVWAYDVLNQYNPGHTLRSIMIGGAA